MNALAHDRGVLVAPILPFTSSDIRSRRLGVTERGGASGTRPVGDHEVEVLASNVFLLGEKSEERILVEDEILYSKLGATPVVRLSVIVKSPLSASRVDELRFAKTVDWLDVRCRPKGRIPLYGRRRMTPRTWQRCGGRRTPCSRPRP